MSTGEADPAHLLTRSRQSVGSLWPREVANRQGQQGPAGDVAAGHTAGRQFGRAGRPALSERGSSRSERQRGGRRTCVTPVDESPLRHDFPSRFSFFGCSALVDARPAKSVQRSAALPVAYLPLTLGSSLLYATGRISR